MKWTAFREQYEAERFSKLTDNVQKETLAALNAVEFFMKPARVEDLSTATIDAFHSKLKTVGMDSKTMGRHLQLVRKAL